MELGNYTTFRNEWSQVSAHNFITCLNAGVSGPELLVRLKDLTDTLECDSTQFMLQGLFNKAEECLNYSLMAVETVHRKYKIGPPKNILAGILSNRSLARCEQRKYHDSLKDAEASIRVHINHTQGYLIASNAHKGLSDYPKAAFSLMQALSRNLTDNFEIFMMELAILVSEMTAQHKEEFKKYKDLPIHVVDSLEVWSVIVKALSEQNKFEALAILTTGECESCCIPSSVVHSAASIPGLTFTFLDVGRMLKFLADKEGTRSWHLKLAIFVVKRKADILTVANHFTEPFLIVMTRLSVEGELPSFLSLAWGNFPVEDYDQKDSLGNSAFHTVTKHVKCCKSTSEIICRELLANGCLATEVDDAGKFPHDYVPPARDIHKILKNTMIAPDDGLLKRSALIRDYGGKAFKDRKYGRAVELYKKAMHLVSKFGTLNSEAAILNSNISAAYLSMEVYDEALKYAESCLKADPSYCKGYYRKGKALSKMGNHRSACEAFIIGFHKSPTTSMKDDFSTDIAKLLHHIPDADRCLLDEMTKVLSYNWPEKVKYLTQNGLWFEVYSLFMGPPFVNYEINTNQFMAGIMATTEARQAVLSTIFQIQPVDMSKFNAPALIIVLIQRGASPESLASSKETTHFHAAVRFSILTSDIHLLKYILELDKEKKVQSSKDVENRTPLHTLCIENSKKMIDIRLCAQIATLLGENKLDFNAKDKYQRTAADYDLKSQLKSTLESIQYKISKESTDQKTTKNYAKCLELKGKGNEAFKNAKYENAYQLYSEAILVLKSEMENPLYEFSAEYGRELAILYGNCAECWNKKGDSEMFLKNAKQSVDSDGSWYKGHWRVAKAYRQKGKWKTAIKAFANAVMALQTADGVGLKNNILSDFVETICEQGPVFSSEERETFTAVLRGTIGAWWPQVVYHVIDNKKWHLAEFVFNQCASLHGNFENIRMGVFCDKDADHKNRWLLPIILHFLKFGADHKTLKFHDGDTYFHATISIIVMFGTFQVFNRIKPVENEVSQLLQFVISQKVIPNNELNIRDNKGNTVLHHLAALKGRDKMREFLANYLLELGVDVMAENDEKKLAIDLTISSDVIRGPLVLYLNKMKSIEKLKNQKQESSNSQTSRQQTVPTNSQTSKQQTVPTNSQTSKQQTVPKSTPKVANPAQITPQRCNGCERRWKMASELPKKDKYQEVVLNLVQLVNCKSSTAAYHKGMTEQATERIATLLTNCEQDIPHAVFKLSAKVFKVILTSLASFKCWTQVEMLVTKFRMNKGQSSLPDFAKNMLLTDLVEDRSIDTQSERINLINLLVLGGVNVDTESLGPALGECMNKSEWQMVMKLLELGADPRAMTLSPGDTPYHAALQVALNKQPGDFSLLEKLKQIEDSQKTSQTNLNRSCLDINGNTILHIAAQAKFNAYSLHAVELLCQWNVSADIRNNENRLAIQCLPSDKDRRAQYLKSSAVGSTMPTASKMSRKKAAGSKEGVSEGTSKSSWTSVQRTAMEDRLKALPVASFNYLNYDTRAKKKVEVVESDSDGEKESDEVLGETDPMMEAEAGFEAELTAEDLDIDIKAFDAPVWDIECTEDVWSVLRSRKEVMNYNRNEQGQGQKPGKRTMPYNLKQIIVKRIQQLASGDWESSTFQITDTPDTLQLFKVALPLGAYILWELAIAFSPRLSESPEMVLSVQQDDTVKDFVSRGSKIYSEVIRLWDIVLKQSELQHVVRKIVDSHERGKSCIIQKTLEADLFCNKTSSKRIPNLYIEAKFDETQKAETMSNHRTHLFPPASAHKNEYHVLKFYSFSSSLVSAALNNSDRNVDFPFRVTDMEHAFINLKSDSPLLLLGRSGTGKTTCCLYRMWNMFLLYWQQAISCGTPMLQRRNYIPEIDVVGELQENQTVAEAKGVTNSTVEVGAANKNTDSRDSQQDNADSEDEKEDNDENNIFQYDHLHQLFVTKNPVLCLEVQKNFTKLYNGTEEMQSNNVWQSTDLPNTFQDMGEFSFPLFVTSRQLLLILDASLDGNPFFPRDEDLALKVTIPGWGAQEDIFNIVPLEHDDLFDSSDDDDDDAVKGAGANRARRVRHVHNIGDRPERKVFNRRECTHDVFSYEVWPKVMKKSKIDCHPSLVWTEILSFIKGSYEALHTEKGYLDKTQYINVGRKKAPNFTGDRSKVYDVFLEYQKYKQMHALFDEADLVFVLYCRLRAMPFQSWILHEIYIDETQDFTQAELALLVSLCSDPNKMFLTGDTAQSIMRGISFRFDDLLSMFFCIKESARKNEQHLSTLKKPQKVHQLRHNYRSHTGILSLAASVLDILLELFKDSFDRLKRDQGMFAGPKPIIIESSSPEDLALLLTGSRRKTSHIEFGAHQAILVVNEEAKAKLPEELGAGIVLTIFESKGLEFDDILLYNFFKDSQAKKEWRVVTNFLNSFDDLDDNSKEGLVEIDAETFKCRPLAFDSNQHKVLNSELKHLYTAITRARVNVWIFDEDEEKRAPMFEYFRARGLVTCMGSSECANINEAIMFADKSTAKEWRLAGDKYMLQQLYTLAAKCYGLAAQPSKVKVALAYQTALEASRMRSTPKAMKDNYFKAGAQFVECGDLHRAAMCFQNSQDFLLSAIAFERNGRFEEASNQYMRAQRANEACNCLEQIGMFGRAVRLLVDNELFDRAIDCLKRYEMEIQKAKQEGRVVPSVLIENKPSDVHSEANLCYRSANSHYSNGKKAEAIAAIKRLRDLDGQIKFLRDHGFLEEAADILGKAGDTKQAAQYMLRSGNTDKALEYAQEGFHKELRAFIHLTIARKHESSGQDLEKIQTNATKALHIYTELDDYNGQAQAKLFLGKYVDLKHLSTAIKDFRKVKPPNQAGELECLIVSTNAIHGVDKMKYYHEVCKIVNLGRNVFEVLRKKPEDSAKYQLYMNFYGMEVDPGRHQVTWYPHQFEPCRVFLKIPATEEGKKFETLEEADAAINTEEYLMGRIANMYLRAQKWLEEEISHIMPCLRMQEGQSCSDDCKFMHRPYNSTQEEIDVLNKIVLSVNLDFFMHAHVERLSGQRLQKPGMETAYLESSRWRSVERLLEFVLPAYPSTQRGQLDHIHEIVKTLRVNKNVKTQVERYLLYLWNNPGRVAKGKSTNVLKERCKSTNWIVNACFFASLLNLQLDVNAEVEKLEKELITSGVLWAHKRDKYALFTMGSQKDGSLLIEAIGTRFLQSFDWLAKEKNPVEAIFPFTKMVSAFAVRCNLSLMPRLDHFVFWIEFYVTLTWLLMAKANHTRDFIKESFYMTNSYSFNLHIVSVGTSNADQPLKNIPQLIQQMQIDQKSYSIMNRLSFMINFLVGHNKYSDFSLISQVGQLCEETPVRFCLAERIIVLSALILLNIPNQYADSDYEIPIRRELCKLNVNELMPERLASLVNSLKSSANYGDVAAALFNYFHQQGSDRLISCQLSMRKKQPFMFIDAQLSESPSMPFYKVDIQAEIEKTSWKKSSHSDGRQADDTTDTEFDVADIARKEAQKEKIQEEHKQKTAVKKIIRLLRLNVMQKRLARKAYKTLEIDDLFRQYALGKTSCGICGVDIKSFVTDDSQGNMVQLFKEIHYQDAGHIVNLHSFTSFKAQYTKKIYPSYQQIMRFIIENKVETSQIYGDIEFDKTKVLTAKNVFETTLRTNLNSRNWSNKETVLNAFTTFEKIFNEHRKKIEDVYMEHKKATKENNNQMGRQHKEHMEESLVEFHFEARTTPIDTGMKSQLKKNEQSGYNRSKN